MLCFTDANFEMNFFYVFFRGRELTCINSYTDGFQSALLCRTKGENGFEFLLIVWDMEAVGIRYNFLPLCKGQELNNWYRVSLKKYLQHGKNYSNGVVLIQIFS